MEISWFRCIMAGWSWAGWVADFHGRAFLSFYLSTLRFLFISSARWSRILETTSTREKPRKCVTHQGLHLDTWHTYTYTSTLIHTLSFSAQFFTVNRSQQTNPYPSYEKKREVVVVVVEVDQKKLVYMQSLFGLFLGCLAFITEGNTKIF